MNKYAHLHLGKIIQIINSELSLDEIKETYTAYGPAANGVWIDVTNTNVGLNWQISFNDDGTTNFVAPFYDTISFDEQKIRRLKYIEIWTSDAIIAGLDITIQENAIRIDTDKDTQLTLQSIAVIDENNFLQQYPTGYPIRAYKYINQNDEQILDTTKSIFYLSYQEIQTIITAISKYINECKIKGWDLQQKVQDATTEEELENINW